MKTKRIFVTVGSTHFDELVRAIDNISKELGVNVIFQIGRGEYTPKSGKWFRYKDDITKFMKWADIIISIDSAGTMFETLGLGKTNIAVRPWYTIGAADLGRKLSEEGYLIFIEPKNESDIETQIKRVLKTKTKLKKYSPPKCDIHTRIVHFVYGDTNE